MVGRFLHRDGTSRIRTYRYHLCSNHYLKAECAMRSVPVDEAEALVADAVRARFAGEALGRSAAVDEAEDTGVRDLRARIDGIWRRMARWESAFGTEAIAGSQFAGQLRRIREQEAEAVEALPVLSRRRPRRAPLTASDGWATLTPAQERAFLCDLIGPVTVYVYPDRSMDIHWK